VVDDPDAGRRRADDDRAGRVVEPDLERHVAFVERVVDQGQADALRRLASRELERPGGRHVVRAGRGRAVDGRIAHRRGLGRVALADDLDGPGAVRLDGAVAYAVEADHAVVEPEVGDADVVDVVVGRRVDRARREVRAALVRQEAADGEPIDDRAGRP